MIYRQLFDRVGQDVTVRAGIIGAGYYGTAIVTQSRCIARLDIPAVADLNIEAAKRAYLSAGYRNDEIVECASLSAALDAMEHGKRVVVRDPLILMELSLDVIVESTGDPEAGSLHALEAIQHGKHVVMVNKETDPAIGPILKHLADQADVVYTTVDGDQPGLLIGLVAWCQELGFEIIAAGKARDYEVVLDAETLTLNGRAVDVTVFDALSPIPASQTERFVETRRSIFGSSATIGGYDVTEMTIVANATGLMPDVETLHCPTLRTYEIPQVMCPKKEGGILQRCGVIDAVTCLRNSYEAGLGGGVFVVVACKNDYSRSVITDKGLIHNTRNYTALIYRPYHLCGVETPISILTAALLKIPTGATTYLPRLDAVARTTRDLKAGEIVGNDHSPDLQIIMRPAQPVQAGNALPVHMASGNRLAVNVPKGDIITADMVVQPENSTLWVLRSKQDSLFLHG